MHPDIEDRLKHEQFKVLLRIAEALEGIQEELDTGNGNWLECLFDIKTSLKNMEPPEPPDF